jgi:DegV family protein with EDD domain
MSLEIVTDTGADIPEAMAKDMGIEVVPLVVNFGNKSYEDGVDLEMEAFLQMLRQKDTPHPTTSGAIPERVLETYRKGSSNILSIHLGSGFSRMWETAVVAASEVTDNSVEVFDSGTASLGEGFMVINAAKWAEEGLPNTQILKRLEEMKKRTFVFASLNTLEFAKRGGRIDNLKTLAGSLLNLKPVLEIDHNVVAERVSLIRKRQQSLDTLVKVVESYKPFETVGVMHSGAEKEATEVADRISGFYTGDILLTDISPAVSSHAGPEAVAVALVQQKTEDPSY